MKPEIRKTRWGVKALKITAFLAVCLLTLAVLFAAGLSFAGRRDWAALKEELLDRGEKLSLAEFRLPPLPDAQNFFGDPMWQELNDLVEVERVENGVRYSTWEVRLPAEQRQLGGMGRLLTREEREALAREFPEFAIPENASVSGLIRKALKAEGAHSAAPKRTAAFILAVLQVIDPLMTRLEGLLQRPGARFGVEVSQYPAVSIARTTSFMQYSQLLKARLWARLNLGENALAQRDAVALLRLPEMLGDSPLLISILVRIALEQIALEAVTQGLEARVWSDRELGEIERLLAGKNLPSALALALRGERAWGNQVLEEVQRPGFDSKLIQDQGAWSTPSARVYLFIFGAGDEAARNRLFQDQIEFLERSPLRGLNASAHAPVDGEIKSLKTNLWKRFRFPMTAAVQPVFDRPLRECARLQDTAAQARTVCALERYRLKNTGYPATLAGLVPEFLPAIPLDVATLQPLRYLREGESFRLWSPGWDGIDGQGGEKDVVWGKKSLDSSEN